MKVTLCTNARPRMGRGSVAAVALVAVATLCGAAGPVQAQATTPPEGCEAFLTVQFQGCLASLYWRCDNAPEGTTWEVSHDEDGPVSVGTYDREFQWLDRYWLFSGLRERLVDAGPDPAEMSRLLEEGEDRYEFTTLETGNMERRRIRYVGVDRLTGETLEVSNETLLETEYAAISLDPQTGEEIYSAYGRQYVLPDERLFFLGSETWSQDGVTQSSNNRPMEILRPGDTGFGDTEPRYGCGAVEL